MRRLIGALLFMVVYMVVGTASVQAVTIGSISDNRGSFSGSNVPKYEKFEITFDINGSTAKNFFFPYDTNMPAGLENRSGITVNAQLLPPGQTNWSSAVSLPAFHFQEFDYAVKSGRDWFYPNGRYSWKVRFSPNQTGTWQYRLTAQDASGNVTSGVSSFNVVNSNNKGFLRVAARDTRYFEFEDGTYFPALGYNMNYDHLSWTNPVTENSSTLQKLGSNGIQLIRIWLSQWAIFGSFWGPWHYIGDHIDYTWLSEVNNPPGDFSMYINYGLNEAPDPCVSFGSWQTYAPPTKTNTRYRIRARVKTTLMGSARNSGQPYGLVIKTDGWLDDCENSGEGTVRSNYLSTNSEWTTISGTYTTGSSENFLPYVYVALENITQGKAYLDYMWIEEDLGNGNYGPNIIPKPWLSQYQYVDQRNSMAFDKLLELTKQNGVYLKVVGLEKNDYIPNHIVYWDSSLIPNSDKTTCAENICFYGDGRMTKSYWLQRAWWRYMQARWGYSTNIHSWELLNEGNPGDNGAHYPMANNFGQFMHQYKPNDHMVTTSFWSQFPLAFWRSSLYPYIDYANVHRYISPSADNWLDPNYADTALSTYTNSMKYGAKQSGGAGKPVLRGETGLWGNSSTGIISDAASAEVLKDTSGVWLHNFIWGQINSGGLIESYWYDIDHIVTGSRDLRPIFGNYYRFISNVPLNNGNYVDADAQSGNTNLRAWGQKDLTNKRAHLWIANARHTWKNVIDNASIPAISTTVTVAGFSPNTAYRVEWWNPYNGNVTSTQNITANSSGNISLPVNNLTTDLAVKIGNYSANPTTVPVTSTPRPSGTSIPGDANGDGRVDGIDYATWLRNYGLNMTGAVYGDFNNNGRVDGADYVVWLNNYNG